MVTGGAIDIVKESAEARRLILITLEPGDVSFRGLVRRGRFWATGRVRGL